ADSLDGGAEASAIADGRLDVTGRPTNQGELAVASVEIDAGVCRPGDGVEGGPKGDVGQVEVEGLFVGEAVLDDNARLSLQLGEGLGGRGLRKLQRHRRRSGGAGDEDRGNGNQGEERSSVHGSPTSPCPGFRVP